MAEFLLVDDSDDVRETLGEYLEMEGHQVRVARDGIEGLAALSDHLPDVALLDVEMPELAGPEMAYRMLVEDCGREEVPIVFMSGVVDLDQVAAHVGTKYYLAKPFSLDALDRVLDQALHEHTPPTYPDQDRHSSRSIP
jgi:CheY-like chemotaxis protein